MERITENTNKNITLLIVCLVSFTTALLNPSVNIALPSIGREFSIPAVTLGWVNNGWVLAVAAFLVPAGRLSDIYGRRKLFFFGMVLFTIFSFLCTLAHSGTMIISCRIIQGIGCGMTISTAVPILTSAFPVEERGRVLGIFAAAVYLGLSVGPFLGGILTQNFGWEGIFFLNAGLGLLVIFLMFWKLKWDQSECRTEKFDLIGAIAYILFLLLILYGITVLPSLIGIVPVGLGISLALGFLWWESKQSNPLLDLNLLRKNSVFVFSNLATLVNYSATTAIIFLLSFYLQYIKGFSPQEAGLILLIEPVVMVVFSPFVGRVSDRVKPQLLASIGMFLNLVSLVLLTFLSKDTSLGFIGVSLAIFGMGMGFFVSPNTSAVVGSVDSKVLGTASGVQATSRYIGMALSMAIVMISFSIYFGSAQITPEYYPSFLASLPVMFIIFAVLCIGGIFAQLRGTGTTRK
jgi:EmrB/QacA subfamily drug resistance transporter